MHVSPVAVIVVQCVMENTPIVPHSQRTLPPFKARHKLVLGQMLGQMPEYGQAVIATPALDVDGMGHAAVDAFSSGLRVGANDRVHHFCLCIVVVAAVLVTEVLLRFFIFIETTAAVHELRREDTAPAQQIFFHPVAQGVEGCRGIGKFGIATLLGYFQGI